MGKSGKIIIVTGPNHSRKNLLAEKIRNFLKTIGHTTSISNLDSILFDSFSKHTPTSEQWESILDSIFQKNYSCVVGILCGSEAIIDFNVIDKYSNDLEILIVHSIDSSKEAAGKNSYNESAMIQNRMKSQWEINEINFQLSNRGLIAKKSCSQSNVEKSAIRHIFINHSDDSHAEIHCKMKGFSDELFMDVKNLLFGLTTDTNTIFLLNPVIDSQYGEKILAFIGEGPLFIFSGFNMGFIKALENLVKNTKRPPCSDCRDDGAYIISALNGEYEEHPTSIEIGVDYQNVAPIDTDNSPQWQVVKSLIRRGINQPVYSHYLSVDDTFFDMNSEISKKKELILTAEHCPGSKIFIGDENQLKAITQYYTQNKTVKKDAVIGTLTKLTPKTGSVLFDVLHYQL